MTERDKLPPLERYVRILELLAAFPDGLTLADVARMLDLPKTSAHRLLGTMQDSDLIDMAAGASSTYVLGQRIARLAYRGAGTQWLDTLVRPYLRDLSAETGETCYLARLDGLLVTSVVMEAPDTPWRGFVLPGKDMPAHAAASAKAILAFQDETSIMEILSQPLPRLTSKTRTSTEDILAEYEQVRRQGYATCIGEIDEGLAALGVPVHIPNVGVIYSVGVTGPLQRIMDQQPHLTAQTMARCAERIAHALSVGLARRPG
ncbi:MAG TPA: IclR family transcriptional regulator [Bordetella sp.]